MENTTDSGEVQSEVLSAEPTALVPGTQMVSASQEPEVLNSDGSNASDDFIPDTQPMVSMESDALPKVDSNEVRKRVLEVKKEIDDRCVEMCALVRTIQVKQLWMNWGYPSLTEYCEQELGIKRTKALYFAQAYKFAEREGLEAFELAMSHGWTKGVQVIRVATKETLPEWMNKAKILSVDSLTRDIQATLAKKIPDEPKEALEAAPQVENTQAEEESKTLTITFPYQDFLAVSQALEAVSALHPGISKGEALGLISGEYAASNSLTEDESAEAKTNSKQAILRQVLKLSNLCGIRIIALDPDTGDFLHGFEDFKELVEKTLGSEATEQEAVMEELHAE